MELLKYVYFYAQKSIIKAGNNKFQDLINAPRNLLQTLLKFCIGLGKQCRNILGAKKGQG